MGIGTILREIFVPRREHERALEKVQEVRARTEKCLEILSDNSRDFIVHDINGATEEAARFP